MPCFLGIDVQTTREPCYAALDEEGKMFQSGWTDHTSSHSFKSLVAKLSKSHGTVHAGIDAPRCPLRVQRSWYWNGSKRAWRKRRANEKGHGRHCEVVLKAHNLANPQWTPLVGCAPEWMVYGFSLFTLLRELCSPHEVFPSATYSMLSNAPEVKAEIDFTSFWKGPKDALDAVAAAVTVREFLCGRGFAVGDGDGLGQIVLPRPIVNPIAEVLTWPEEIG